MDETLPDIKDFTMSCIDNTSPSQLQEVTFEDESLLNTMGLRSPGPMRGRSVKEFEEQLTNLKKENFNLKLRIYFLEEKMGTNFTLDKDNVVKKNIELKVEIANLQKELQEKHDLLCQAVKAMELEDEEHKKSVQNKEEVIYQYQQEMEDLRLQLQSANFDFDCGASHKSDLTGCSRGSNMVQETDSVILDLQEKLKVLDIELNVQKENNASLQLVLDQAEASRIRCESLQKESEIKDEKIKNLSAELDNAKEEIAKYSVEVTDLQMKLETSKTESQEMNDKIQEQKHLIDEMSSQISEMRKKYGMIKQELDKEHKRSERSKMICDLKIDELEDETGKQKLKIRELQSNLEAALIEMKKHQNLAVSKSLVQKPNVSNTEVASFLVSNPTTPDGTPETSPLHVPLNVHQSQSSPIHIPSTLDTIVHLEELLHGAGEASATDKILSDIKHLHKEHMVQKQKIVKLKSEQMKACEIIKSMITSRNKANEENAKLKKQIDDLEHELESVVSKPDKKENVSLRHRVSEMNFTAASPPADENMDESGSDDLHLIEEYRVLTSELETKIELLEATLKEKDSHMQNLKSTYEEMLSDLQEKENRIVELEFELISNDKHNISQEKFDKGSEKQEEFYQVEIQEKEKEIERLNGELKKCTCYLQEIVNKELWEKNREIEKMHNKSASMSEITKLRKDISCKDLQLKLLKEKISELGIELNFPSASDDNVISVVNADVESLQEQLKMCKDEKCYLEMELKKLKAKPSGDMVEQLQKENAELEHNLRRMDKLRMESTEICSVLSGRLEELAIFLDSLLKQKSVLGFLGIQKNKKLREIIDSSLDLSRSFAASMMMNPDQSLAQLSNLTSFLNNTAFNDLSLQEENNSVLSIVPSSATLTYQSHLYKQNKDDEPNNEQVILALREQVFNLKCELQLRDNELNRLNGNQQGISEKTTESDVDMMQSNKINNILNTTSTTLKYVSDNQSESEGWSEPDRNVSRARMGLVESPPHPGKSPKLLSNESTEDCSLECPTSSSKRNSRQTVSELQKQITELQEELFKKNTEILEAEATSKNLLESMEEKVAVTEKSLALAEAKKEIAESRVLDLEQTVNDLMNFKKELEMSTEAKDKETQDLLNQLEIQKDEALKRTKDLEKELSVANNEIFAAKTHLAQLHVDREVTENKLRKEYEDGAVIRLKSAEEECVRKIKAIEDKAMEDIAKIEKKLSRMQEQYSKDYIRKCEVDEKMQEVGRFIQELGDLKKIVKSYEEIVSSLKSKENELRHKLQEYEDRINTLRNDLDTTTLQYSEVVLEKTRLANEKTLIEKELNKTNVKELEMKMQFSEIKTEFNAMKVNFEMQISNLLKQKSKLEVKISELESTNAELHNRLVRVQASRAEFNCSLPNIGAHHMPLTYKRQFSDNNFGSEEGVSDIRQRSYSFNRPMVPGDVERHEANSSPDLGIESDHGRFSSLETNTLPRPLLQSIETTEAINHMLDGDNNHIEGGGVCDTEQHCCQKVMKIAQENNDLKLKVLKLQRAFEETAYQLNLANQRKKQVEKHICKQINKTSQVLRKAKANLDSGSESDLLKS